MKSNFLLGSIKVTKAARKALGRDPLDLVARHAINDHGNVTLREAKLNLKGYKEADTIVSRFVIDPTNPELGNVLVITSPSWGNTTVRLESEK